MKEYSFLILVTPAFIDNGKMFLEKITQTNDGYLYLFTDETREIKQTFKNAYWFIQKREIAIIEFYLVKYIASKIINILLLIVAIDCLFLGFSIENKELEFSLNYLQSFPYLYIILIACAGIHFFYQKRSDLYFSRDKVALRGKIKDTYTKGLGDTQRTELLITYEFEERKYEVLTGLNGLDIHKKGDDIDIFISKAFPETILINYGTIMNSILNYFLRIVFVVLLIIRFFYG